MWTNVYNGNITIELDKIHIVI